MAKKRAYSRSIVSKSTALALPAAPDAISAAIGRLASEACECIAESMGHHIVESSNVTHIVQGPWLTLTLLVFARGDGKAGGNGGCPHHGQGYETN